MKIKNSSGLAVEFLANGSIKHIEAEPIRISLKSSTPFSKPGANIFLRKRNKPYKYIALTGPESNSIVGIKENTFFAKGRWNELDYFCTLQLSKESMSWQWHIEITNTTEKSIELDLFYLQDIGLKQISNGLTNEYYVSQYIERLVFEDSNYGAVICCRQNMKEPTGNPWTMIACPNGAIAGCTDGMQFYGKTYRETGIPEAMLIEKLGGNLAGESSIVALQEKPFILKGRAQHSSIFIGSYQADHPKASSPDDLKILPGLIQEFTDNALVHDLKSKMIPAKNSFSNASFLTVDDLTEEELDRYFGTNRRHTEIEEGQLFSFFCKENNHVVLRAKESLVDRPHGHIMQAKSGFSPDENIVSTTAYAFGVFNSHLTQGNTNFNVLLSVCTSQFNLNTESGQRIFVEIDGQWTLLGVPSAFEMGLNHCRWIYKSGNRSFQVRTWTSKSAPRVNMDFHVLSGEKVKLMITHDFDELSWWNISQGNSKNEYIATPGIGTMITQKFPKAHFRILVNSIPQCLFANQEMMLIPPHPEKKSCALFVLKVEETFAFCMSFIAEVVSSSELTELKDADSRFDADCRSAQYSWKELSLNLELKSLHPDIAAINEILPWYGMNALIHFLTPYGLEQFSGAAWGTRDVSQGPIDLLLTMGKYDEAKQVLHTIFSNQNPDGGWPQWWMFDSYSSIRAHDSHGDVFYWVIIALSDYIKITGDYSILDDIVPFYFEGDKSKAEFFTIREHVDRLIQMIVHSFLPGTAFVPFGGGDWNDSLQPVSRELAERLISSWTVEMNYQSFRQYSKILEKIDEPKATELNVICERIKIDFNKHLMKEGVVAGYGLLEEDGSISLLLHPSDTRTGIKYSILPMNRGIISELFTEKQAKSHQSIIDQYLKGPDGARLMDRPLPYKGGLQTIFQRAESSTFFGREIGLMYIHEHIRYAESQARLGNADAFVKALRQAIPVDYKKIVPCGDIRQANCYYSSSDVSFKSRYEADVRYDAIKTGNITLKGGWRIYSSGPGIYVSMIVTRLLGIRIEFEYVVFDPVLPLSMDGLSATLDFMTRQVEIKYNVKESTHSPKSILVNERLLPFGYQENAYRHGGAIILLSDFISLLKQSDNTIEIFL
ncbi:MAG: hypothetical protein IPM71_02685 [Bacteroidota bacterium]|nr:MAG: hypothetical protein IPM71_02685 [Bacteroidota bacterium]